jgi:hypothetical protein
LELLRILPKEQGRNRWVERYQPAHFIGVVDRDQTCLGQRTVLGQRSRDVYLLDDAAAHHSLEVRNVPGRRHDSQLRGGEHEQELPIERFEIVALEDLDNRQRRLGSLELFVESLSGPLLQRRIPPELSRTVRFNKREAKGNQNREDLDDLALFAEAALPVPDEPRDLFGGLAAGNFPLAHLFLTQNFRVACPKTAYPEAF